MCFAALKQASIGCFIWNVLGIRITNNVCNEGHQLFYKNKETTKTKKLIRHIKKKQKKNCILTSKWKKKKWGVRVPWSRSVCSFSSRRLLPSILCSDWSIQLSVMKNPSAESSHVKIWLELSPLFTHSAGWWLWRHHWWSVCWLCAGAGGESTPRSESCSQPPDIKKLKNHSWYQVTQLLNELHWLPVKFHCKYKIVTLGYCHFDGTL